MNATFAVLATLRIRPIFTVNGVSRIRHFVTRDDKEATGIEHNGGPLIPGQ